MAHEYPAQVVAASAGRVLHLWDAPPGTRPAPDSRQVTHSASVNALCWNRNNKVVATGCADGTIQLTYAYGEVMSALPRNAAEAATFGSITSLAWSTGSRLLAAGSSNGSVYVHDIKGKSVSTMAGHVGGIRAVQYHPDDKFLAVASGAGVVSLYAGRTSQAVRLPAPTAASSPKACLAASATETLLAGGCDSGTVLVWDAARAQLRETYAAQHTGAVSAVAFVPLKPAFMYSAGRDGCIVLQDRRAGPGKRQAITAGAPISAFTLREDHSVVAAGTADGAVLLFDPRNNTRPLYTLHCGSSEPVSSLHWQHMYHSLSSKTKASSAALSSLAQPPAEAAAAVSVASGSTGTAAPVPSASQASAPAAVPQSRIPPVQPQQAAVAMAKSVPAAPQQQGALFASAAPQPVQDASTAASLPLPRQSENCSAAASAQEDAGSPPAVTASAFNSASLSISPLSAMAAHRGGAVAAALTPGQIAPMQQQQQQQSSALEQRRRPQLTVTPPDQLASATLGQAAVAESQLQLAAPVLLNISPLSSVDTNRWHAAQRPALAQSLAADAQQGTPGYSALPAVSLDISPLSSMRGATGPGRQGRAGVLQKSTNSPRPRPALPLPNAVSVPSNLNPAAPHMQQGSVACSPAAAPETGAAEPGVAAEVRDGPAASVQQYKEKHELGHTDSSEPFMGTSSEVEVAAWSIKAQLQQPAAAALPDTPGAQLQQQQQSAEAAARDAAFDAAQRSMQRLHGGLPPSPSKLSGIPPSSPAAGRLTGHTLQDDILAMHLDMLNQFQTQQQQMSALVTRVVERQDALAAEVAGLRKQLGRMMRRREEYLWL